MLTKINLGISIYIMVMYFLTFHAIDSIDHYVVELNQSMDKSIAHLKSLQGQEVEDPDLMNRSTLLQSSSASVAAFYIGCPSREHAPATSEKIRQISIDELLQIFQSAYDKAAVQERNISPRSFIVKDTFKDFVQRELSAGTVEQ